jgi:predicted nucleic acid-binding Zn ribbon protein
MPLQRGSCDFCGRSTVKGRTYCGKECRVAYNNLLARQGKTVMQMLKVWRKHRGAKGTPGEGMIGEIATRVDAILEEDRERKRRMRQP